MFKNALVTGVLVHDSLQPASSIKTQPGVSVLNGTGDVLQNAGGKAHMADHNINRVAAVLSADFLHSTAQLDEILHHDLDHGIDLGSAGSGKILNQKAAGGAESCPKRVYHLEDTIK